MGAHWGQHPISSLLLLLIGCMKIRVLKLFVTILKLGKYTPQPSLPKRLHTYLLWDHHETIEGRKYF
jgi:hypothetical protein